MALNAARSSKSAKARADAEAKAKADFESNREKQNIAEDQRRRVLARREELQNYVTDTQPLIRSGFAVHDKLRQQLVLVQDYGDILNANEDFEYKVKENIEYKVKEVTKKASGLKQKYLDANSKKSAEEQIMIGTVAEFAEVEHNLNQLIDSVRKCLNKLNEITLSQGDYIDNLIASEEQWRKTGFKNRVDALKEMKENQEMMAQMSIEDYVTACIKKIEIHSDSISGMMVSKFVFWKR